MCLTHTATTSSHTAHHSSSHTTHHAPTDSVDLRMVRDSDLLDVGLESSLVIGHIFHHSLCAVRLVQHVSTLGHVSVAHLPRLLVVTGVVVLYSVVVFVVGNVLQGKEGVRLVFRSEDVSI